MATTSIFNRFDKHSNGVVAVRDVVKAAMVTLLASFGCLHGLALAEEALKPAAVPALSRFGPSFGCPTPRDPLGQLICDDARLSRGDLEFVQTYQALRQQSSAFQQAALRTEAISFGKAVRTVCGVGTPAGPTDPVPGPSPSSAAACVGREYGRQRAAWAARLDGAAAQEAKRGLAQQISLQRNLQQIGLLPKQEPIDGVYGDLTRAAVIAFQQTMGLPTTGLIGDGEAAALAHEATARSNHPPVATPRSAWDDFLRDAATMGVKASISNTGACLVGFEVRNPGALANATRESAQHSGGALDDAPDLFAAEMLFLQTQFAARGVHAFYASLPASLDRCRFEAAAFTVDIYGRDMPEPLFSFLFDREIYAKIVWRRFEPVNMPKIMLGFAYGPYASQRLGGGKPTPELSVPAAAPLPGRDTSDGLETRSP